MKKVLKKVVAVVMAITVVLFVVYLKQRLCTNQIQIYGGKIMRVKMNFGDEKMYHIGFGREDIQGARYALLPGDPGRQFFAEAEGLG